MKLLFPQVCLVCGGGVEDSLLCEECTPLIVVNTMRGVVEIAPEAMALISTVELQPRACRRWLISLLLLCLSAPRFERVTTLVVSLKSPLYSATCQAAKLLGLSLRPLEKGRLSYLLWQKRPPVPEVWALIELQKTASSLSFFVIPQNLHHLPLFTLY